MGVCVKTADTHRADRARNKFHRGERISPPFTHIYFFLNLSDAFTQSKGIRTHHHSHCWHSALLELSAPCGCAAYFPRLTVVLGIDEVQP